MKYLKITNTPDGLRLARCLVGSPCKAQTASHKNEYYGVIVGADSEIIVRNGKHLHSERYVDIPIDTLKLDPFAAMRYGVSVVGTDGCSIKGIIVSVSQYDPLHANRFCINNMMTFCQEEITLDLSAIERGEVDGASVVEVGE